MCARIAGSSASGMPALTSSICAPASTCAIASATTVSKLPAAISAARALRPVGLMRSPITTNGRSKPITTSFVARRQQRLGHPVLLPARPHEALEHVVRDTRRRATRPPGRPPPRGRRRSRAARDATPRGTRRSRSARRASRRRRSPPGSAAASSRAARAAPLLRRHLGRDVPPPDHRQLSHDRAPRRSV